MSSQPETPGEQLPEPPFLVPSDLPKPRAFSVWNPAAQEAPSSSQPEQSGPSAEPGNDNTIDGAPRQNRNGGGNVSNLRSPSQVCKC